MATASVSAVKMRRKTTQMDALLHDTAGFTVSLLSLRPRSKTWGREGAATVGKHRVRVF